MKAVNLLRAERPDVILLDLGRSPGADVQYLRVYVRQLRQKLEPDPTRPRYILTESGIGYRLAAAD